MLVRSTIFAVVLSVITPLLSINLVSAQTEQQRQLQQATQLEKAVSIDDAIAMSSSGLSPQLIINQIRSSGVQQEIGVSQIITLHQNGVSEVVINEMQQASVGGPAATTIIAQEPGFIVEPAVIVESAPVVVARPRPTIVFEQHGNIYRSHRGYHAAPGKNVYHRPPRSAYSGSPIRR